MSESAVAGVPEADARGPQPRAGGRLRVLAIAEMANPGWVSVPLIGWSHARALAREADVHLVTHVRNRPNILAAGLREGVDFTAIDTSAIDRPLRRVMGLLGWSKAGSGWSTYTALSVFSYYAFEREIWRRFAPRLAAREFDLVHRITPVSPALPSRLAAWCRGIGVPFVLGPLNGGVPWPPGFMGVRLREREFLGFFRGLHRLLPGHGSTRRAASAILVGSRAMSEQIEGPAREKVVYLPENAIDPSRFTTPREPAPAPPLRVAFVGRLVPVKCVDVLVEAAAPFARAGVVHLEIIGAGPELPKLQAQVEREGIGAQVTFAGWVDHVQIQQRLARAHVFGFPSVRDFGGGVVLEAMAMGLVPIVVDYGGPAELVTPRTGFAVPMGRRKALVEGFRGVLEGLVRDPGVVEEMGARARDRALRHFTWDAKARQVLEVYRWVLGQRERPDFGMPFRDP